MNCGKIKIKKSKLCIGSLSKQITIYVRTKTPSKNTDEMASIETTVLKTVWACVESRNGSAIFNSSQIEEVFDTLFYIRYIDNLNISNDIVYNGNAYKIINVENLNLNSEFLAIRAINRGSASKKINRV